MHNRARKLAEIRLALVERLKRSDNDYIDACCMRSQIAIIDHVSELFRSQDAAQAAFAESIADVILSEMEGAL